MKLRRLDINGLPGIREPFALNDVGDGFNVIVGPNGVGKSSLCRAVRSLLWAKGEGDGYIDVSALFDRGDQQWRVERRGSRHRWQLDGIDELAPPLPAPHLDACFFLVLRDLLDASDDAGSELATQIRRLMSGGFDLEDTEASVFGAIGSRHGRKERRALDEAERKLKKAVGEHEQLSRREQQLGELEEKRTAARIACGCP